MNPEIPEDGDGAQISGSAAATTKPLIIHADQNLRLTQNSEVEMKSPKIRLAKAIKSRLHHGVLHSSRLGSFIANGWPVERVKGNGVACTPQELALAGLEYVSKGSARCFVCWKLVSNLEASSDPWERHQELSPTCPLIKLGKPLKPDGYPLKQFFTLLAERQARYTEQQYSELEGSVKSMTKEFCQCETREPEGIAVLDLQDSF